MQPKKSKKWWLWIGLPILIILCLVGIGLWHGLHQNNKTSKTASGLASGLPDCQGHQILQYSPVAVQDLSTIVPLGNQAPPGHIVPTVHMYYNYKMTPGGKNFPVKTNLIVPTDMTVTKITLEDNNSSQHPFNSYRVDFAICKQMYGYFYHPVTLNDTLTAAIKPPYDETNTSNVGAAKPDHSWAKYVNIKLKAGELLGTGGGAEDLPDGLDFGLSDTRFTGNVANPMRATNAERHYVCSLNYYPPTLSQQLSSYIGGYDYIPKDPGDPKCGTVYQDIPGTAKGNWFAQDLPSTTFWDSNGQLSLATYNLDHTIETISFGNDSQKIGINSSALYTFKPSETGDVNREFSQVKPGTVYCYNTTDRNQFNLPSGPTILIELTDATTLKIGKISRSSCGTGPWQFGDALTYVR